MAQISPELAQRFLLTLEQTFQNILEAPEVGSLYETNEPALQGIRCRLLRRFRKSIVFYRVHADRVEILHVLHGARNMPPILLEPEG